MSLRTSTIRPGILVSLHTSLTGNVKYYTNEIEPTHILENGLTSRAKWDTTRTILDATEHERAVKARSKARSVITGACAQTNHGMLCTEANRDNLEKALLEAERIERDFNATATCTRLNVNVVLGVVSQDDERAIRAINREVTGLLAQMEQGVRNLDATAIRKAADAAMSVGKMLSQETQERLQASIDQVRKEARKIVKAGETAAVEIDQTVFTTLQQSRTAFLELEPVAEVAAPEAEGRGVDFNATPQQSGLIPAPFTMPGIE